MSVLTNVYLKYGMKLFLRNLKKKVQFLNRWVFDLLYPANMHCYAVIKK